MANFSQRIKVFADKNLSAKALSEKLVAVARKALADAIAAGSPTAYRRFVDGSEADNETGAKTRIRYEFTFLGDAVAYALERLIARSPDKSGQYLKSFRVAVNGRSIPAKSFVARSVPPDAEVFIYNTQPYSRKVDVQIVGNKRLTFSVAPNLFAETAKEVKKRFGNTTVAERLYTIDAPDLYILQKGKAAKKRVQSPALRLARRE